MVRNAVIAMLIASPAAAMFMMPTDAPVDRLITNARAYLKENPNDANGHYVLGRVHYLTWSGKTGRVPVWQAPKAGEAAPPAVVPDYHVPRGDHHLFRAEAQRRALEELGVETVGEVKRDERNAFRQRAGAIEKQLRADGWKPAQITQEQLDHHARRAVVCFTTAISCDKTNGLYVLARASIREQYAQRAAATGLAPDGQVMLDEGGEPLERKWLNAAMADYKAAFDLSRKKDAALRHRPITGIGSLVSHEATDGFKRVAAALDEGEQHTDTIRSMDAHCAKLAALPRGPITPIVFSLEPHDRLADLIDAQAAVTFDLDGAGRDQRWQWVKPNTALLVWDPLGTGQITCGRQLFGSVTWWLMPGDGYRAMDLLDDNRDGELTDDELRGLSAWFDRNGNGVSDNGEVRRLDELGITGLAVKATARDGDAPMHPAGLRLNDGATRPTYDWIAQPAD